MSLTIFFFFIILECVVQKINLNNKKSKKLKVINIYKKRDIKYNLSTQLICKKMCDEKACQQFICVTEIKASGKMTRGGPF